MKRTKTTKKTKHTKNTSKSRKIKLSKHNKSMHADLTTVWGKNKPLENFWRGLSNGKNVVVIYSDGKHKFIKLQSSKTKKLDDQLNGFDEDSNIKAYLTAPLSQDSYETGLFPKAKDKTVDEVINSYKKYFKNVGPPPKDFIKNGNPLMQKALYPIL